jgi:UDP-N-acetylmuramyl tripeptide synthase
VGDVAAADRGFALELDRARAIELAVLAAAPGDTVMICGKGHEEYQVIGERRAPFDDRAEARLALAQRRSRALARNPSPAAGAS